MFYNRVTCCNNPYLCQDVRQLKTAIEQMNTYGREGKPFLFLLDFDLTRPKVWALEDVETGLLRYQLSDESNLENRQGGLRPDMTRSDALLQVKIPYSFHSYTKQFNRMMTALKRGDTYLVNLTCQTAVNLSTDLDDLYDKARAKYKLKYKDEFVCFSPETFVRIKDGVISTCPMKGTIDATLPDARERLLNNVKEKAEHSTVFDLLRNDLSCVASRVKVEDFRYVEEVGTDRGRLLQVSSLITGVLPADYPEHIGDIVVSLLPAGSVTGAPKDGTVALIKSVETYKRGYYTGVFGRFDGRNLDSAVLIRFVERTPDGWVYKSGGGITALSQLEEEYHEMQLKVYVPIH